MNKKKLLAGFIIAVSLIACKQQQTEQEIRSYIFIKDTVYIQNDLLREKLRVSEVRIESYVKEVVTAGTVQAIPTQFAYIAPPFSGRVVKSYIKLGQEVKANTPLFDIISPDFTSAQKEFYQAQSERELAQKDLLRKQDLIINGVGSQKELEEAQNLLLIAEKEYENSRAALRVYQTDPEHMSLGQPLIVRAPISGHVIENAIVTGQYITTESDPVAIVADLSKVWVVAQVKEKDIRFIHEGDEMDIYISAFPGKTIQGTVYHVDEAVDEETRSIKVLSVCDNGGRLLKLGMYTTVHFLDKPADCVIIPETALLQNENDSYVFVELGVDTFVRKVVETEGVKNGEAIITKGLEAGERIIDQGGYYLK